MALDPGTTIETRKVNLQLSSGVISPEPLSFTHLGLSEYLEPTDHHYDVLVL